MLASAWFCAVLSFIVFFIACVITRFDPAVDGGSYCTRASIVSSPAQALGSSLGSIQQLAVICQWACFCRCFTVSVFLIQLFCMVMMMMMTLTLENRNVLRTEVEVRCRTHPKRSVSCLLDMAQRFWGNRQP